MRKAARAETRAISWQVINRKNKVFMAFSWKISAGVIAAVALFAFGYWTASQRYEKEIAEGMLSAQKAAQAIERSRNEKIVGAMNERIEMLQNEADAARVERDDARRIADRLRRQSTARVPEGSGDSCRNDREENARLRGLLAEAVELLQEGRQLYRGSAGAHDALADAVR